jgi:virulence factor Mce-like protein
MTRTGRGPHINPLIAGFVAGVLIAAVVGVMATINLQYGAPWADTKTLTAQVTDADSMSIGSDVRIAGRLVGQVVGIKAAGDHTDITFHVDGSNWPLPADTTAQVRLATLLGQKYIQLNPGHSSKMLTDKAVIGLQSTKPVVDFDQILNTFDKPTRDALTQLIRTGAAGVQNQEGTLQQLFPDLAYLSVHSQVPTHELVVRNSELSNILGNLGVTADQLNQSRDDLAAVIDELNSVNAALASNEGQALKGYIVNTDILNQTTHAVLGNGAAAQLDNAFNKLPTLVRNLNSLLTSLIPQSQSFNNKVSSEPSDMINSGGVPSKAAIDLIYEIGSATSQGDANCCGGQGNFFLRQNVSGVDACGLLSILCAPGSGQAPSLPSGPGNAPLCLPTNPPICLPPGSGLPSLPHLPSPPPQVCSVAPQLCNTNPNNILPNNILPPGIAQVPCQVLPGGLPCSVPLYCNSSSGCPINPIQCLQNGPQPPLPTCGVLYTLTPGSSGGSLIPSLPIPTPSPTCLFVICTSTEGSPNVRTASDEIAPGVVSAAGDSSWVRYR